MKKRLPHIITHTVDVETAVHESLWPLADVSEIGKGKNMVNEFNTCASCGMNVGAVATYHPFTACLMFRQVRDGNVVAANLRAVVEYGMKAHARGVDLATAMNDITSVRASTTQEK